METEFLRFPSVSSFLVVIILISLHLHSLPLHFTYCLVPYKPSGYSIFCIPFSLSFLFHLSRYQLLIPFAYAVCSILLLLPNSSHTLISLLLHHLLVHVIQALQQLPHVSTYQNRAQVMSPSYHCKIFETNVYDEQACINYSYGKASIR